MYYNTAKMCNSIALRNAIFEHYCNNARFVKQPDEKSKATLRKS